MVGDGGQRRPLIGLSGRRWPVERVSHFPQEALKGEEVAIKIGRETVRLVHEVSVRPPGYFADCYRGAEVATFEGRVGRDSKPTLEE